MSLEIIPVVDVMNGIVVHAVAGKRNEYKPLSYSAVARSSKPEDVFEAFKKLCCRYVYIADLDAIMEKGDNRYVIDIALSKGFKVLADVGRRGLLERDMDNVSYVIGTEYLVYPNEIPIVRGRIVSLDIKKGRVLFKNRELDVDVAAKDVCSQGVKIVIVLNLDKVGTNLGIDFEVLNKVRKVCSIELAVGGGLKDVNELLILKNLGVKYVLVATAIHKGVIDRCTY